MGPPKVSSAARMTHVNVSLFFSCGQQKLFEIKAVAWRQIPFPSSIMSTVEPGGASPVQILGPISVFYLYIVGQGRCRTTSLQEANPHARHGVFTVILLGEKQEREGSA